MKTQPAPREGITVKHTDDGVTLCLTVRGFPGVLITRPTFAEALRALTEHVERRESSFPTPVGVA
jgi:hypothetical protein